MLKPKDGVLYRDLPLERVPLERAAADGATEKVFRVAISSEAEITRTDWFGESYIEVLSHDPGAIDMTRLENGAAVLVDHRGDQVGVIVPDSVGVGADRKMRGDVRFSRSVRGQEIQQDVEDEIRTSISVGYFYRDYILKEQRGDVPVYLVTRWTPAEVSIVSVPADITVGVGRNVGGEPPAELKGRAPVEVPKMKKVRGENGAVLEVTDDDARPAITEAAVAVDDRSGLTPDEQSEVASICHNNGMGERVGEFLKRGLKPGEVARLALDSIRTRGGPTLGVLDAVPARDMKRYSYARAILAQAALREGTGKFDGLEAEVHQELDSKMDASLKRHGGIFVPTDRRTADERMIAWEKRTLDSKTVGKGPEAVYDSPGEFIELLRNQSVLMRAGARTLGGLTGPLGFTKQTGGMTIYWVSENPAADVTASDIALGLINMVPKYMQGTTGYTRQFLGQSSIDVEGTIRADFSAGHALALDRAGLHGKGASGEPTGIYKAPDVGVRAVGGVPDFADVVQTTVTVANSNALLGSVGWILTPGLIGVLKGVASFTGSTLPIYTGTILEGNLDGYRAMGTNQLSKVMTGSEDTGGAEHGCVFGNFNDMVIGLFAALELVVDPYAQKKKAIIEVTSYQGADIILRHGESFCKWTGATLT